MSNLKMCVIPEKCLSGRGRLGRHVEHDARSRAFGIVLRPKPLRSAQWKRHCGPFDQGDLGSCTGNAMAGALMTGPLYQPNRNLNEEDAVRFYSAATRLDRIPGFYPPSDTGSSGLAVARAVQKMGLITAYHHAFGVTQTLHALSYGPVLLGINWYDGFDEPEGKQAELKISGELRGGHEVVLDGINVEDGYVYGTNSWGKAWGNEGKFALSFGTLTRLLKEDGDVVVPIS